jgi:hypothetical protein
VEDEFKIEDGGSEGFLPRQFAAESDAASHAETAFDIKPTSNIWSGIPDILLYKLDGESELEKILIGEVKYSADKNYLKEGIRELLEYVYLCSNQDGDYLMEGPSQKDAIDERIEPVLFTRQLSGEVSDDSLPISIVEYGSSYTPFEEP